MNIIEQHKTQLIELCKKHHVKTLYVFGSALRDDFNDESDVDFSVVYDTTLLDDPLVYGKNAWDLTFALERLLKRHVDLISEGAIKNRFFKMELDLTKQLFYAA